MKTLTAAQQIVVKFLEAQPNKAVSMRELENKFHRKTINTLLALGTIIAEGKSRFREDDHETVFWTEARLPNQSDKIKELLSI